MHGSLEKLMTKYLGDDEKKTVFLSDEEDRTLREMVRTAMQFPPSTPSVTGCPDPETIRKIAFHEKVDRKTLEHAVLHLPECCKCTRLADKHIAEYQAAQAQTNKYIH
jgi:hypothetical protein